MREKFNGYILESEQEKILREVKNDLLRRFPNVLSKRTGVELFPGKPKGLIETMQRTLPQSGAFKWQPVVVVRGGRISLADGGFPYLDSFPWDKSRPEVVPYESIAAIPCLVLLGEPGWEEPCHPSSEEGRAGFDGCHDGEGTLSRS